MRSEWEASEALVTRRPDGCENVVAGKQANERPLPHRCSRIKTLLGTFFALHLRGVLIP
jgi:hypothetical protein